MSNNVKNKTSGEFDLIARYFQNWPSFQKSQTAIIVPNGDDCLVVDTQTPLAISVDTIVENVHFLTSSPAHGVGYRALATAVSDLVAMGATPSFFTLAISFNKDESWLKAFSQGLKQAAQDFKIDLLGGDTTHLKNKTQPSVITIQVHGECQKPVKRSTAKIGDLICVTGNLGDAAAAVSVLEKQTPNKHEQAFLKAFYYPKPPVHLSELISEYATSAIDISDGLLADLMHICKQSQVKAKLNTSTIPLSDENHNNHTKEQALKFALSGGDDYQVCFTINPNHKGWAEQNNLFIIGEILDGSIDIINEHNQSFSNIVSSFGYQHF